MIKFILLITILSSYICVAQKDNASKSSQKETSSPSDDLVFTIVEQMPCFPGGELAMMQFIQANVKYPEAEKQTNISGTCYVTFVVEKDGSISNVKTLRGIINGAGCDIEAVRVISMMPPWIPGKQNGREVRVQFNLPVKFTLRTKVANTAAADTTYFNSAWIKCSKSESEYYRIVSKLDQGYFVQDIFSKNNQPQMIAVCSALDPLVKNGKCTFYSEDKRKLSEGNFIDNEQVGIWNIWNKEGKDSLVVECFTDGTYKNIYIPESQIINTKYNVSYQKEEMPQFPGGEAEMMKFIIQNVKYPKKEQNSNITGTCYITFVVEKDGTISGVRVIRGIAGGPGCDQEALRVVNLMPVWNPGLQFGRPVRVQFNLPIKFTLRRGW